MKYSHLFHGETNHNRPQSRSIIDVPLLLETSEISLGSQIDGSFYPQKNVGRNWHPPKFENSKNMWHPGIPNNWKSRMPNLCRISISDFWAEESFKWVAASPGRYPMAGSQKIVSQKRQSSENPAKTCGLFKCLGLLSVWVDDKLWIKRQPKM